jgi:hypothetical protein
MRDVARDRLLAAGAERIVASEQRVASSLTMLSRVARTLALHDERVPSAAPGPTDDGFADLDAWDDRPAVLHRTELPAANPRSE